MITGYVGETLIVPIRIEDINTGDDITGVVIDDITVQYAKPSSTAYTTINSTSMTLVEIGLGDYSLAVSPSVVDEDGFFRVRISATTLTMATKQYVSDIYSSAFVYPDGMVYCDVASTYSGTASPVGSSTKPADSVDNAIAIARANNLSKVSYLATTTATSDTLSSAYANYRAIYSANRALAGDIYVNTPVTRSHFDGLNIKSGQNLTDCEFVSCKVSSDVSSIRSEFETTTFLSGYSISLVSDGGSTIKSSLFQLNTIAFSGPISGTVTITDCSGDVVIHDMTDSGSGVKLIDFTGKAKISSSCTAGSVVILGGSGEIYDESTGTSVVAREFGNYFSDGLIHCDYNYGSSGSALPYGTVKRPCNRINDAVTLSLPSKQNIRNISYTPPSSGLDTLSTAAGFFKVCSTLNSVFNSQGHVYLSGSYYDINLEGLRIKQNMSQGQVRGYYKDCLFVSSFSGRDVDFNSCEFSADYIIKPVEVGTYARFNDCRFMSNTISAYVASSPTTITMTDSSGNIVLSDMTSSYTNFELYNFSGKIKIDASCSTGTINIYGGAGALVDSSTGASVVVSGFVPDENMGNTVSLIYGLEQLMAVTLSAVPTDVNTVLSSSHGVGDWSAISTVSMQNFRDAMLLSPSYTNTISESIDGILAGISTSMSLVQSTLSLVATTVSADYAVDQAIEARVVTISSALALEMATVSAIATTVGLAYALEQVMAVTLSAVPADVNTLLSSIHGSGDWSVAGTLTLQAMRDAMLLSPSYVNTISESVDGLLSYLSISMAKESTLVSDALLITTGISLIQSTLSLVATTVSADYALDQATATTVSLIGSTLSTTATTISLMSSTLSVVATTVSAIETSLNSLSLTGGSYQPFL